MGFFENFFQDVAFGLRTLRKNPAFTALAVLTLALGIGANTAIFSVINAVLLQPLPYTSGEDLVLLQQSAPGRGIDQVNLSIPEVMDYRAQMTSLDGVVEYHSMSFTLLNRGEPDRVLTGVVSHNFFDVLGVTPILGRTFQPADDELGAEAVLILSNEYWQQRFGGDPSIVGQVFEMNDKPHTVVGVLPPVPQYPRYNDVYMPTVACPFRGRAQETMHENRRAFGALTAFGRVKEGYSEQDVAVEMAGVAGRFVDEYPAVYTPEMEFSTSTVPLFEELTRNARPMLLILLATSGLVLLTACANVANLMVSRMLRRARELAVRSAMGAGRGRLIRQLLTESVLLSVAGGAVGLLFAWSGLGMLTSFVAQFTPRTQSIAIDGWVLAFSLGVAMLTGLAFGVAPALSTRDDLVVSLKDGGNQSTESGARMRLRSVLVVAQVAVSFVLLIGAGLLLTSFLKLSSVDAGFSAEQVLTAEVFPNWTKYQTQEDGVALFNAILDNLEGRPGIISAAVASNFPLSGANPMMMRIAVEGQDYEDPGARPTFDMRVVTRDYFQTAGIPLMLGRTFAPGDHMDSAMVGVVSESFVKHHFPDTNPIGRRVSWNGGDYWIEIIGVVADVRDYGLDRAYSEVLYQLFDQEPMGGRLLVRTSGNPMEAAAMVREAVHGFDPDQPVENFQTMAALRSDSIARPRLTAALLGLFGGLALVITMAGITGVVATSVSQRTGEFGIRMALGARAGEVMAMVMKRGLALVTVGVALGAVGALSLGRALAGLLYDTDPADPFTFVLVGLGFLAAAAVACCVPARRATAVDPIIALKAD
jgi:putative ABC transport system permease protein